MKLKRRVSLGSKQLDEIDKRIVITGVDEAAGKDTISAVSIGGTDGQRITQVRRDTLDVTVKFAIAVRNDHMETRATILEAVNKWAAAGGWLTLNYRPQRRLYVVLAQAPGGGDMFQWTNEYSIVFRAYGVPYWEAQTDTALLVSRTAAKGSMSGIQVPGNVRSPVSFTVTNRSGATINTITNLQVKDSKGNITKMGFTGLGMTASQQLQIGYDRTNGMFIQFIKLYDMQTGKSTPVAAARTPASDDEFIAEPGQIGITWDAQRAVELQVITMGRWL